MTSQQTLQQAIAATAAPPKADNAHHQRLTMIVLAVVLGVLVVGGLITWAVWPRQPIKFTDKIDIIARFCATTEFRKLPFERQIMYMKVLHKRKSELKDAQNAGKITKQEHDAGHIMAWFGEHLDAMEDHFALRTEQEKVAHLDKLLLKKPFNRKYPTIVDDMGRKVADKTAAIEETKRWPPEARTQWLQFHKDLSDRQKQLAKEQAAKKTAPAASSTTKPKPD